MLRRMRSKKANILERQPPNNKRRHQSGSAIRSISSISSTSYRDRVETKIGNRRDGSPNNTIRSSGCMKSQTVKQMRLSSYSGWSFSAISLSEEGQIEETCEMLLYAYEQMHRKGRKLDSVLPTLRVAIKFFVEEVADSYTKSKFHNFSHAVDVTQMMFNLVTNYFQHKLEKHQLFYLLVAALCHDMGHPGATAATLNKHGLINGSLEMFHASRTVDLITREDIDLFNEPFFTSHQKSEIIEYCSFLIDATDISKHKQYLEQAGKTQLSKDEKLGRAHLAILMKVSDLANLVRDFKDGAVWSENLKLEFMAEALLNKQLEADPDLPEDELYRFDVIGERLVDIQENLCRENQVDLSSGLANNTLNFIKAFVLPLSKTLSLMDETAGGDYGRRVRDSQTTWLSEMK